ncbi:hypothetical protein G6F37_001360 [Rhizopus arrhizus]|nr:hypothetical protein G6F38_007024 [Rhizopus arrhizus]KAG1163266.1 hypothetical protein G6F37_001360 [Rhizopus arrhizus]
MPQTCTSNVPAYSFDAIQLATACGVDRANSSMLSRYASIVSSSSNLNSLFKCIVIILPTTLLAFVAFSCTLLLRKNRENNLIPLIGSLASLLGFIIGAAGLALVLVIFIKGLDALEQQVNGLSHEWGAAIYMIGFGVGCTLATFICFIASFFFQNPKSSNTFDLNDYSSTTKANDTFAKDEDYVINDSQQQQPYPTYQQDYPQSDQHSQQLQSPNAYTSPHTFSDNTYLPQSPNAHDNQTPHTYDTYQTTQPYQGGYQVDQKQTY